MSRRFPGLSAGGPSEIGGICASSAFPLSYRDSIVHRSASRAVAPRVVLFHTTRTDSIVPPVRSSFVLPLRYGISRDYATPDRAESTAGSRESAKEDTDRCTKDSPTVPRMRATTCTCGGVICSYAKICG